MPEGWTVRRAIEVCDRGRDTAVYLSGGVAGLAIIGSGDLASSFFARIPGFLMPVYITLLLATAAVLARSLRAYLRQKLDLERSLERPGTSASDPAPDLPHQRLGERFRQVALVLLVSAAAWLLVAVWWAGVAPTAPT